MDCVSIKANREAEIRKRLQTFVKCISELHYITLIRKNQYLVQKKVLIFRSYGKAHGQTAFASLSIRRYCVN